MATVCPLFSGSKGNSTYIGYGGSGIIIDAGVSCRRLCEALGALDVDPSAIGAVFITHEHSDHIKGLRVFEKKAHIPICCSELTRSALLKANVLDDPECITPFEHEVQIGGFTVTRFTTSHDCPGSSGYTVLTPDEKRVSVCTDLGLVTDEVFSALLGSDLIVLESNHDLAMLRGGPYPPELKMRIASDKGHLSNACCGELIVKLAKSGTTRFILAHLSDENNTPLKALESAATALELGGFTPGRDCTVTAAAPSGNKAVII